MSLPYALMPVPRQSYVDADGYAYAGGTLTFYVAGTMTPKAVYTTPQGTVPLGTSVTLDASGMAPAIYLEWGAYDVRVTDADGATLFITYGVSDTGGTYFARIGQEWTAGVTVTSDYTVLGTDALVQVDGATPIVITLQAATARLTPLGIKNIGSSTVAITRSGSDTVEGAASAWVLPAGDASLQPTVWLLPDGTSAWWIIASHGCAATSLMEFPSESMSPSHSPSVSRSPSRSISVTASPTSPSATSPSPSGTPGIRVVEFFFRDWQDSVGDVEVQITTTIPSLFTDRGLTDEVGRISFDVPTTYRFMHVTAKAPAWDIPPRRLWRYDFTEANPLEPHDEAYCAVPAGTDLDALPSLFHKTWIGPYVDPAY